MSDKAVIYEVELTVDADAAEELGAWLPGHMRDMLALESFEEAIAILSPTP